MRALIVIPTYNEKDNIKNIILLIRSTLQESTQKGDILVVDDNSPDGTALIVEQLANQFKDVNLLLRQQKSGLGKAYIDGFSWALSHNYEAVIEMDADFSHHPKYLPTMLNTLKTSDVAIGSRYVKGGGTLNWSFLRRMISKGGGIYARWILNAPIKDFTGGFNGWKTEVLKGIQYSNLQSNGYSFQIELKYRAFKKGYRIVEFPILFEDRKAGSSKMSFQIMIEAFSRVLAFKLKGIPEIKAN
jgi:dolichol-phosphate mannosyltransferase